ncbi:hypothetical protein HID58_006273, partial [Brassica napus]
ALKHSPSRVSTLIIKTLPPTLRWCTLRTFKHSRSPRWCLWHCGYWLHPPTRYL